MYSVFVSVCVGNWETGPCNLSRDFDGDGIPARKKGANKSPVRLDRKEEGAKCRGDQEWLLKEKIREWT